MATMGLLSRRSSTRYGMEAHIDIHVGIIFPYDHTLQVT